MNRELLEEIVIRGGLALQAEDCAIRAAVHHRGEKGGILRMQNERYYQFIVWRAVLPVWPCEVERQDNTDLVVHSDNGMHHFEMKSILVQMVWLSYREFNRTF